ncbi:uncharacterized CRM domain-containing protein At3g25440, chloroplastic-like isoform X1 [Zingiber officinale]|uniref:uncharacterized CRM domain-containing protein At3g25440, chloroplastic-like isoform X1 n=1 Tax=Zingiber officinale TaxID=94328 RepID=UPI001C4AFEC3|nr:uncharacterized CRM domain-containing protein At3g25440, chloroplastic-like isoform X1 [Zingiber officinale]
MISAFRRLAKSERIGWFHGLISPCGRSRIPLFDRTSYSLKRFGNGNYLKDGTSHIWKDICISHFSSCAFSSQWSVTSLVYHNTIRWQSVRFRSDSLVTLNTEDHVARFSIGRPNVNHGTNSKAMKKPLKKSRKAKLNELKWFRLKAKKKMKSPNPEVRIRYKLEKAKRKEVWLIEKLRKYEIPKGPLPVHDPEILTKEEKFYLKRTGEKKNNYVPVGRRGLFGGVVLNMHMHWKKHETVKVVCKPCRPGQIHEYAEELARLSKGMVIDIKAKNTIIFYRGKNYVQPDIMSPPDTLSKQKALEKYKFEQSLEHTSQFIEKLERQLEEYHKHVELYQKNKDIATERATATANGDCSVDRQ